MEEFLLTLVDEASGRKGDGFECLLVVSICYFVDNGSTISRGISSVDSRVSMIVIGQWVESLFGGASSNVNTELQWSL